MTIQKLYNLDRLKVCYRVPATVQALLEEGRNIDTGVFRISTVRDSLGSVEAKVYLSQQLHGEYNTLFGTLLVKKDPIAQSEKLRYAWLTIDNKYLYLPSKHLSIAEGLKEFTDEFDAMFNNVCNCDVALDMDYNVSLAIFKVIRDTKFELLVMGTTWRNPDAQNENIRFEMFGNRREFTKAHVYVNGKDNKFQFCVYDKREEVLKTRKKDRKDYILNRFGVLPAEVYRMEVRMDTDHIRKFAKKQKMTEEEYLFNCLLKEESLPIIWNEVSKKFLRVRKDWRHIWSILEVVENDLISDGVSFSHLTKDIFNVKQQSVSTDECLNAESTPSCTADVKIDNLLQVKTKNETFLLRDLSISDILRTFAKDLDITRLNQL